MDLLRLAECGLPDRLALMEMQQVQTSERAESDPKGSKVRRLNQRMRAGGETLEALLLACVCVDEMWAERASLNKGTEQAKRRA